MNSNTLNQTNARVSINNDNSNAFDEQTESSSVYDRQDAMQRLAEMSLPIGTKAIMLNVDSVIADAMKTINSSLKQSSNHIEKQRIKLMKQHPSLTQAYDPQGDTPSQTEQSSSLEATGAANNPTAPLETLNHIARQTLVNFNQNYESQMTGNHREKQQHVVETQSSVTQAVLDMQKKMMIKHQSYQKQRLGIDEPSNNVLKNKPEKTQDQKQNVAVTSATQTLSIE
ncbi:hypothetical protein ACFFUP_12900 [Vibrio ostreicida]|uniref:Uncharacterized protein n=1 Tax=Vibrio ostreicida TaxID=526588 RepID=A0ABT8BZK6_9VIBR|nr:hypothetical protein [Vibrio ostreicida]MDN3611513.1 hypothetical protein [Vibrio ostreicida]NPD09008.1 hypothetical protein [Vibrio ostreicida]